MGVGRSLPNCYNFMDLYIYIYDSNYNNNNTVFTYKQYIGYSCNVWWGLFVTV